MQEGMEPAAGPTTESEPWSSLARALSDGWAVASAVWSAAAKGWVELGESAGIPPDYWQLLTILLAVLIALPLIIAALRSLRIDISLERLFLPALRRRLSGTSQEVEICTLTLFERMRLAVFVFLHWSPLRVQPNAVVPLALKARGRRLLRQKTRDSIDKIQDDQYRLDAVIIGNAYPVPSAIRIGALDKIRRRKIASKWVQRAMKRVVCIMGSRGYVPLPDSYNDGTPNYIFHAKGIEELRDEASVQGLNSTNHAHKLFFRAATVQPHLPFGPGLERARVDSAIAPDAVAFIFMHQDHRRAMLGPLLYFLEGLEDLLGANVALLAEKIFQIIPDQDIRGNSFGGVEPVALFGAGSETGRKYMRFDYARLEPVPAVPQRDSARAAIAALRRALDIKTDSRFVQHQDLLPGDVLIINNWRVATAWDEECSNVRGWGGYHVHGRDRLVFQMNFYRPRPDRHDELDDYDNGRGGGHH